MPEPQGAVPLNIRRKYEVGLDPDEFAHLKKEGIDFTKPLSRSDLDKMIGDSSASSRTDLLPGSTAAILKDPVFSKLAGATGAFRIPRPDTPILPSFPRRAAFPTPSTDGNVYFAVGENMRISTAFFPGLNNPDAGSKARAEAVRALASELRKELNLPYSAAKKVALKATFVESPHAGVPGVISIPQEIYDAAIAPRVMEIRLEKLRVANLPKSFAETGVQLRNAAIKYGAIKAINEIFPFDPATNTYNLKGVTTRAGFDGIFHAVARESLTVSLAISPFHSSSTVNANQILNEDKLINNLAVKSGNAVEMVTSYREFKDILLRAEKLKITNAELFHALSSEGFSAEKMKGKLSLLEGDPSKIDAIRRHCMTDPNRVGIGWLAAEPNELARFTGELNSGKDPVALRIGSRMVYPEYLESAAIKTVLSKNIEAIARSKTPADGAKIIGTMNAELRYELSELYRSVHAKDIPDGQLTKLCDNLRAKLGESSTLIENLTAKGLKPNEIVTLLLESGSKFGDFVAAGNQILAGDAKGKEMLESLKARVKTAEIVEGSRNRGSKTPAPKAAIVVGAAFGCFHEFMTSEYRKTDTLLPGTLELLNSGSQALTGYGVDMTYRKDDMLPYERYAITGAKTGFDAWIFAKGMHTAERGLVRLGVEAGTAATVVGRVAGGAGVAFVGVEGFMTQRSIPLGAEHDSQASWSGGETVLTGAAAGSVFGPIGTVVGGGVGAVGSFGGAVTGYFDEVGRGEATRANQFSVESLERGVHGFVFAGKPRPNSEAGTAIATRMAAAGFRDSLAATFNLGPDFKDKFDFAAYEKFAKTVASGGYQSKMVESLAEYGFAAKEEDVQKVMEYYYTSREMIGKVLDVEGHSYNFVYVEDEAERKARASRGLSTTEKCERLENLNARFKGISEDKSDDAYSKLERLDNLLAEELPMLREIVANEKLFRVLSQLAPDIAKSDFVKSIQKDLVADRP
jgi:hypothetical protein